MYATKTWNIYVSLTWEQPYKIFCLLIVYNHSVIDSLLQKNNKTKVGLEEILHNIIYGHNANSSRFAQNYTLS